MSEHPISSMNVTRAALNSVVFMYPTSGSRLFSMMGWMNVPNEEPADTKLIANVRFFLK